MLPPKPAVESLVPQNAASHHQLSGGCLENVGQKVGTEGGVILPWPLSVSQP